MVSADSRDYECGHQEERGRRQVAGNAQFAGLKVRPAGQGDGSALYFQVGAEFAQCQLGVIARAERLMHGGLAVSVKAGQQHAAFYLGACNRRCVVDRTELGTANGERRKAILPRLDAARPFAASGCMMRSMGRRERDSSPAMRVTNGCAARIPESMRMVDPELPASSAAEGSRNPSRPTPWSTNHSVVVLDLNAQRPHTRQRRLAIGAARIICDLSGSFRDPGQHRRNGEKWTCRQGARWRRG